MSRLTLGTVGIAAVFLAGTFVTTGSVQAQDSDAAIEEIVVTGIGSRGSQRSAIDLAVPVDVLSLEELNKTGQIDIGQALHFVAPSFSAVKFGINDLSPLTDPATLRGLSPDQTLLLVNGKRRHKVSFFNLNHGLAKGQLGNDINAIPAAAIKQVEILRDGAAAQYGSDAIAGVINMVLNDASSGGSIRAYTGVAYSNPEFDGRSPVGAELHGRTDGCHAVPMDLHMPDFGNTELPFVERKNYRKICYFLGIMLNANGERFVDEGENFRNYTYAQFGREILNQPQGFAWQLFDSQIDNLLYDEYRFADASFVEADTLAELVAKLDGVYAGRALNTIYEYNDAVDPSNEFDPTILDGRRTNGLPIDKTNWANTLHAPPFKAFPVTCGITFTYAGLRIDKNAAVLNGAGEKIPGLFACGEMVGGVFCGGYPGGSGLTSGAVFGRIAGRAAAQG